MNIVDTKKNLRSSSQSILLSPKKKDNSAVNLGLKNDKRLLKLENFMRKMNYKGCALLEILHKAQEIYGYINKNVLAYIAEAIELPASHVFGVATFYSYFKQQQPGKHVITACLGTACYVKGVEEIICAIEKNFSVKRGGSSDDGKLSLFITRCIGACAIGPAIIIDDDIIGNVTEDLVLEKITSILEREKIETC
ncbi:NAD(P)H-dependent oxidoreductase subunit E [Candidatus Bathyarchaeota archaeon]|nr:NAD(P)H-dependent oxidoreductase subunit E [Candidatus Bathyarchaeota archaeon]